MKVLVTAGPTREYLDDVRYLSNDSSGKMGFAVAAALAAAGHDCVLVSGPVRLAPPAGCEVRPVVSTGEMRAACEAAFSDCDGVIATAAVCDYRPAVRAAGKLKKTGGPVSVELIETDDVLAALGARKADGRDRPRWVVGFALEAANPRENALQKLRAQAVRPGRAERSGEHRRRRHDLRTDRPPTAPPRPAGPARRPRSRGSWWAGSTGGSRRGGRSDSVQAAFRPQGLPDRSRRRGTGAGRAGPGRTVRGRFVRGLGFRARPDRRRTARPPHRPP